MWDGAGVDGPPAWRPLFSLWDPQEDRREPIIHKLSLTSTCVPKGDAPPGNQCKEKFKKKKRFLWKQMIKMTRAKLLNFYTKYFTVTSNAGGSTTAQLQYLGFLTLCPGTSCYLCFQRGGRQPSRSWIQRSCTECFQNRGQKMMFL